MQAQQIQTCSTAERYLAQRTGHCQPLRPVRRGRAALQLRIAIFPAPTCCLLGRPCQAAAEQRQSMPPPEEAAGAGSGSQAGARKGALPLSPSGLSLPAEEIDPSTAFLYTPHTVTGLLAGAPYAGPASQRGGPVPSLRPPCRRGRPGVLQQGVQPSRLQQGRGRQPRPHRAPRARGRPARLAGCALPCRSVLPALREALPLP